MLDTRAWLSDRPTTSSVSDRASSSPAAPASSAANLCRHLLAEPAVRRGRRRRRPLDRASRPTSRASAVELLVGSILDDDVLDAAVRRRDVGRPPRGACPSVPRSIADPVTSPRRSTPPGRCGCSRPLARGTRCPTSWWRRRQLGLRRQPDAAQARGPARPSPQSPYAASKLADRGLRRSPARACCGLEVLAFRFFNVFGPLQAAGHAYAAVVPAFVDAALAGRPRDGARRRRGRPRDFTFVDTGLRASSPRR